MFGLFKRERRAAVARKLQLTVLYAMAANGLSSAEAAFGLRDIIRASKSLGFNYWPPGTFEVCFNGSAEGEQQAANLAEELRRYAKANGVPAFGVGTNSGECIAEIDAENNLTFPPVGDMVTVAMLRARKEAEADD